jgi:hypothetical protein
MKLLFNKTEYYGHWFDDNGDTGGFTEKAPPNTRYIFNEEINDWILNSEPEIKETTEVE